MKAEWRYSHSPPKLLGVGYRKRQMQMCWKFPACPCPPCSTYSSSSQCPVLLMASDSAICRSDRLWPLFCSVPLHELEAPAFPDPLQVSVCPPPFVLQTSWELNLLWCSTTPLFSSLLPVASDYLMSYFYNKSLIPQNSQWFYLLYWIWTQFVLFPLSYSLSLTIYFQSTSNTTCLVSKYDLFCSHMYVSWTPITLYLLHNQDLGNNGRFFRKRKPE